MRFEKVTKIPWMLKNSMNTTTSTSSTSTTTTTKNKTYNNNTYYYNNNIYGQRHAKRDIRTYAKSVDPDQPPRLRRRVWSGPALFDTRHINGAYISCCVNNLITHRCFQYRVGADLGLHYLKCPKVPFRVTLAIYINLTRELL